MIELHNMDCLAFLDTLDKSRVSAIVSDPPYGMKWSAKVSSGKNGHGRRGQKWGNYGKTIANDDKPFDPSPFLSFPDVILFGYNHFASKLPKGTTLVWIKTLDRSFGSFLSDAEIAWMKGGEGVYCKRDTSMLANASERVHTNQKPVSIMKWCILKLKLPQGSTIFDPFMGSGSTGVAAVELGYNFIGCEIDEGHFRNAEKRVKAAQAQLQMFSTLPNNRVHWTGGESPANLALFPAEVTPPAKVTRKSPRQ